KKPSDGWTKYEGENYDLGVNVFGQSSTATRAKKTEAEAETDTKTVAFGFKALNTTNVEQGNFLDSIRLHLNPAVEFSAANDKFVENAEGEYPIRFKIVGLITSEDEMPSLDFKIEYSD